MLEVKTVSSESFLIIRPILFIARICGLCPIAYEKNSNFYTVSWSKSYEIYSYVLLVGLSIWTMVGQIMDSNVDKEDSVRMVNVKMFYVSLFDINSLITIVVFLLLCMKKKMDVLWTLLDIWGKIDTKTPIQDPKKYIRASIFTISFILTALITLQIYDMYSWYVNHSSTLMYEKYTAFYCLYTIVDVQGLMFGHMVYLIKIRMEILNEKLEELVNGLEENHLGLFGGGLEGNGIGEDGIDGHGSKMFWMEMFGEHENVSKNLEKPLVASLEKNRIIFSTLKSLKKTQKYILKATEVLNNTSSFGIILIIPTCMVHLVVTPYLFNIFFDGKQNLTLVVLLCTWMAAHLVRVMIIIEPCQGCLHQVKKSKKTICRLLKHSLGTDIGLELSTFFHEPNFNAYGLFNISRGLVTSMIATASTYLVILFQLGNP